MPQKQVLEFIENFDQTILLNRKGNSFNQKGLIELIERYWNSDFLNDDFRDELYQYFHNIIKLPVRVAAKLTDLDSKDVRFFAEEGQPHIPVYFLNKELKAWMKQSGFNSILNRIVKQTPKYGNTVLKIMQDDVSVVRLSNLICDPTVEKLEDSAMVIEEHFMSLKDILDQKGKWDNIDEAISWFEKNPGESYMKVHEIYLYQPRSFFGGKGDETVRGVWIVGNLNSKRVDRAGGGYKTTRRPVEDDDDLSIDFFKAQRKKLPYFEFFWDEYQGRWLRSGIVEELLEEQMAINEVVYLEMKNIYWNAKKMWQTTDPTISKNLLKDVTDGEILRVNADVAPVAMEERNQGNFNALYELWSGNATNKTLSFDAVSGKTLPSATPFRSAFIQQSAASGYFDFQREDIGILINRLIKDIIAPIFIKKSRASHTFNFVSDDPEFSSYEEMFINKFIYERTKEAINNGRAPTRDQVERARNNALEKLRNRPNRKIEIPADYYNDLKFKVDVLVTDEQVAIDAKLQTLVTILQTISTNPGLMQNESTKRILFRILDLAGVSPEMIKESKQPGAAELLQTFSPPPGQQAPQLQTTQNQLTL